ncbi:MAG: ion channel-forming bestrophin family protein, partial [Campylobacterota bacterium]|nr:ion channel-forming bestrophin family protein [Campylobacterota bacterium]
EEIYGDKLYSLPSGIASVTGLAVAFFVAFRMNTAYDRWWEARKIMGELAANSRKLASRAILCFNKSNPEISIKIIDMLKEYCINLKEHLFEPTPESKKSTLSMLHNISLIIETKLNNNTLEKFDLLQIVNNLHDIQGKAERTKFTPFLNVYKVFTKMMVYSYVLILPFLIGDIDIGGEDSFLEFLAILLIMMISHTFLLLNKLANLYGEPFDASEVSLPIDDIVLSLNKDLETIKELQ